MASNRSSHTDSNSFVAGGGEGGMLSYSMIQSDCLSSLASLYIYSFDNLHYKNSLILVI